MKLNILPNISYPNIKTLNLGLLILMLFSSCDKANKQNNKQVALTAEHEAALDDYFDLNINFFDTLIKFQIAGDKLILDMGNTPIKSWNITAFWMNQNNSDEFYTEMNNSYFLSESNLIELDLPKEYDRELHKDLKIKLGVSHRGISYISNYKPHSSTLTSFFYDETGENILKPIGEEWRKMKHILHRVNYMNSNKYPDEIREFLTHKEQEIIQNLDYIESY